MANIYGTGKDWGAIRRKLAQVQLTADDPSGIAPLLDDCQAEYETRIRQVRQKLKQEITDLRHKILQAEGQTQAELADVAEDNALAIEQSEATLDVIKDDGGPFKVLRNFLRAKREKEKINNLRSNLQEQHAEIEEPLNAMRQELDYKKAHIDDLARQECADILSKIEVLRSILGSSELAGAVAEGELREALGALPENCHVLQDVEVSVSKGILFEGLQSVTARLDALVLTPSGLFAIGLRNTVKPIGEKETGPDPYEQVKRSAQLCHEMLKTDFPGLIVRNVLAYRGRPPETTNPGIVKALPLAEVASYIGWFKDSTLSDRTLQALLVRFGFESQA